MYSSEPSDLHLFNVDLSSPEPYCYVIDHHLSEISSSYLLFALFIKKVCFSIKGLPSYKM